MARPLRRSRLATLGALLSLLLFAAACGDDGGSSAEEDGDSTASTTPTESTIDPANLYEDPRGGLYADFQETFDRGTDPFSSLDEFCESHDAPDEALEATDAVSADSVVIVHLRTKLEDLVQAGFAVPVGNTTDMYETFTRVINEKCGGINGRKIDLRLVEVPATSQNIDADRRNACIQATEDNKAPIVLNSSGFQGSALLCITEEHDSILYTSTSGEDEWVERSDGRLISNAPTLNENVRYLARYLGDKGVLEGKKIAVVTADTPGQPEAIEAGLIDTLKDEYGIEVAQFDVIGCKGGSVCTDGTPTSVDKLISNDIDVLFPALNVISLPQYIKEMAAKGIANGQIQMYQSNFNSQAGDLVSGQVVRFGGPESGTLYNGTVAVDPAPAGIWRQSGYTLPPFNKMCQDTYNANNKSGDKWDYLNAEQNSRAGMVATVCSQVRSAARAIYHAGANPSRADLLKAYRGLGPIDVSNMDPAILSPDRPSGANILYELKWNYPCPGSPTEPSCYQVQGQPSSLPEGP